MHLFFVFPKQRRFGSQKKENENSIVFYDLRLNGIEINLMSGRKDNVIQRRRRVIKRRRGRLLSGIPKINKMRGSNRKRGRRKGTSENRKVDGRAGLRRGSERRAIVIRAEL